MSLDFYLGANTPKGFSSYFSEFTNEVSRLYIIKGGPGCGKSTAMKRIADTCERDGAAVQRIWCASDNDSLDGVYIPDLDTLYVDGTAPHIIEPKCPGAKDEIINFGDFWDSGALASRRGDIEKLSGELTYRYSRIYGYLCSAGELSKMRSSGALRAANYDKLIKRANRISAQNIPARKNTRRGRLIDIFIQALTPDGFVFLNDFSNWNLCELYDTNGIYGAVTGTVGELALRSGYTVYFAHSPLDPAGAPLHVIIPELRFALLTSGGDLGCKPTGRRRIRLDMMTDGGEIKSAAARQHEDMVIYSGLIKSAMNELGMVKVLHDELENIYKPAVDFEAVNRLCEKHCKDITDLLKHKNHGCRL